MEPGSLKDDFLNAYCNSENPSPGENLKLPIEIVYQALSTGEFKGDVLIDVSFGPIIDYRKAGNTNFRDIIFLKPTDVCVLEAEISLDSRTGAFDSSHTSAPAMELAGTSDQEDKKIGRKTANINVAKFDLSQENLTDPLVLPQADCLVINTVLGIISRNLDDFEGNLGRFTKLLKPGGHLLYCGYLNATYYGIGGERFEAAKYNEGDLERILSNVGFVIINIEVSQTEAESDLSDFDAVVFCTAYKEQEP